MVGVLLKPGIGIAPGWEVLRGCGFGVEVELEGLASFSVILFGLEEGESTF